MSAILAVENLASAVQFPAHVVTANEEPSGTEAYRFATLRRSDHWSPTTLNADAWLKIVFDRVRAFDFLCVWDHNLAGESLRWQASDDDFSTIQTLHDAVLPTTPGAGDVDDALGVLCDDGKWIRRIPTRSAKAIRLYVPAMGADQKPSINGLVGLSVAFDRDRGDLPDVNDLQTEETRMESGYVGRGTLTLPRTGAMPIKFVTEFAYEQFRYHWLRYGKSPGVLIFNELRAEQSFMAQRPTGRSGFRQAREYFYPSGELPFQEWEAPE